MNCVLFDIDHIMTSHESLLCEDLSVSLLNLRHFADLAKSDSFFCFYGYQTLLAQVLTFCELSQKLLLLLRENSMRYNGL